jgi:outer membrane murein-binding lipoprotein Lpp
MRILVSAFVLGLTTLAANAQQPQASPEIRACNNKLGVEINNGLQLSSAVYAAQDEMAKLHARIKELEDKYEPKTPAAGVKPKE